MKEDIKQFLGGFPEKLFEHPKIIEHIRLGRADSGGGYIGRWQERTKYRDETTYQRLKELNLGDDFIVLFLINQCGRWYAESFNEIPRNYGFNSLTFFYHIGIMVSQGLFEFKQQK